MGQEIIDVVCVLQKTREYTEQQVKLLFNQVKHYLNVKNRFVCISDVPVQYCDKNIDLKYKFPRKWCKIEIFRPDIQLNNRILYFDLDTIILEDIGCFITQYDFILRQSSDEYKTKISDGKQRIKRYNSAIMSFIKKSRPEIWDKFNQRIIDSLYYDQDYLGYIIPNEKTYPIEWSTKFYPDKHQKKPNTKVVCFCGKNKSYKFKNYEWIKKQYEKFSS